jgi:hypothetical protein
LQPPGQGTPEERALRSKVQSLEAQLTEAQTELVARRAAQAEADAPPPELLKAVEKDYAPDPANKSLSPDLQKRIRIYTAKPGAKLPANQRHLLLVPSEVTPRRTVVVPTVDCEAVEFKGLRVIEGRFLAASTDKGVFYSDLSRPASADAACESFVSAGSVRFGKVGAIQAVRTLEILPDALREAGLSSGDARSASVNAGRMLGGREQFEIYGNRVRLLATYPVSGGAGLTVFWPETLPDQPVKAR